MNSKIKRAAVFLFALVVLNSPLLAWHEGGHQVVALIAYARLDAATRTKIAEILTHHPRFEKDFMAKMPLNIKNGPLGNRERWLFAQAAIWPDLARAIPNPDKSTFNHPLWHFVNSPMFLDEQSQGAMQDKLKVNLQTKFDPSVDLNDLNAWQVLDLVTKKLSNAQTAPEDKAVMICWALHLVGDLHQPLHCVAMFSENVFPDVKEGDRGGNRILIVPSSAPHTVHGNTNLHSFWDDLLGGTGIKFNDVQKRAAEIMQDQQISQQAEAAAADMDPTHWTKEGETIAAVDVYEAIKPQLLGLVPDDKLDVGPITLTDDYKTNAGEIAQTRVGIGGYRLAKFLSDALR